MSGCTNIAPLVASAHSFLPLAAVMPFLMRAGARILSEASFALDPSIRRRNLPIKSSPKRKKNKKRGPKPKKRMANFMPGRRPNGQTRKAPRIRNTR
jgi:hypothetical protein